MAWMKRPTVEVPLLLTYINFSLIGSTFTNLVVYRSCYVLLNYNKTECAKLGTDTNDNTKNLETLVEPTADIITMVKTTVDSILPVIICMMAGPWSDKNGRKPVLLITLSGIGLSAFLLIIFSYFENLSPWYFLIASIPLQVTGGTATYFTITLSYLSDISTPKTRGTRMAVYEATVAAGVLVGSVLSSYLLYATNYETVFAVAAGCMLIGILYTAFLIPESLQKNENNMDDENAKGLNLSYLKDMMYTSIKKRENYNRAIIILTILSIIIFRFHVIGDYGIQFIFLRKRLNWTLTKFNMYYAAHNVLLVFGTMGGTLLFHKIFKVKETILTLVGLVSTLSYVILELIATNDVYIYSGGVIRSLSGLVSPMLRSQVSKMVPPNEAGKIFSMVFAGGALIGLGTSPLFTLVYNATITTNSAAFNYLSIGLLTFTMLLVLIVMTLESKSKSYPLDNEKNPEYEIIKTTIE